VVTVPVSELVVIVVELVFSPQAASASAAVATIRGVVRIFSLSMMDFGATVPALLRVGAKVTIFDNYGNPDSH